MGIRKFKTVGSYLHPDLAQLVRAHLAGSGIDAFVAEQFTDPSIFGVIGGARVQVPEADYERAMEVLNESPEGVEDL